MNFRKILVPANTVIDVNSTINSRETSCAETNFRARTGEFQEEVFQCCINIKGMNLNMVFNLNRSLRELIVIKPRQPDNNTIEIFGEKSLSDIPGDGTAR